MRDKTNKLLEFNIIREMLAECATFNKNKERLLQLEPYLSEGEAVRHQRDTTEGKKIIESCGTPPLSSADEMQKVLEDIHMNAMLTVDQLNEVKSFLVASRRLKSYLKKGESISTVGCYEGSIYNLIELEDEIVRCIRGSEVDERATNELQRLRKKIHDASIEIKDRLNLLLQKNHDYFSDHYIVSRNDRFTLPVKRKYKNSIKGSVVDISNSGETLFIEPSSIGKIQEDLALLKMEEENEVIKILYTLTSLVASYEAEIIRNIEAMEILDFIFAKAKLSIKMRGKEAELTTLRGIEIVKGRHPLIQEDVAVPLDFKIGNQINGETIKSVVITGPNTGGKTVVLKTVGLLSLMTQSGLHVPVEKGRFTMNSLIMCDIGDGQSISENLSTFSSHMTNIINILNTVNDECLVLLDELGSGTDPAEGMGLAVAILEALSKKNCLLLATTHYPEIKDFAREQRGFVNAKMAFHKETLLPLYRLEIGEAGESCALYIAKKLGLNQGLLERAYDVAYKETKFKKAEDHGFLDVLKETGTMKDDGEINSNPNLEANKTIALSRIVPIGIKEESDEEVNEKGPDPKRFNIGDSVIVYPSEEIGIVYKIANDRGELIVQIKGEKYTVNHKRLKLKIKAEELYPEGYDFSVIFDSVEKRKVEKLMNKRHVEGLTLILKD